MKGEIGALLDRRIKQRQVNRVLHNHPGRVLWKERDIDVEAVMAHRQKARASAPKALNVYVATPYCLPTEPDRCGFCLFPSEEYRGGGQLAEYLGYLRREGAMYKPYFEDEVPESIYFGGGTSNLYRPNQYVELMNIVREVFPKLADTTEITLEGIPQTYTLEKLTVMKECGINRISVGVQQFDDALIAFSGRKQKREHVVRVLEWCAELGLRTSVDLIFGWPHQTVEHMLKDLETAVSLGVTHLTHYELNVGGRTDFARNHAANLPSIEQTLEMFHRSREYLTSCGFQQVTTYDWEKADGGFRYEDAARRSLSPAHGKAPKGVEMWGWGFAGISTFPGNADDPGWIYMNSESVQANFAALDAGRYPIASGYRYAKEDLELTMLYQALLGMAISRERFTEQFGCDVHEKYRDVWDALVDRGWMRVSATSLELVGDGIFFTPTIQELVSQPRVKEIQRALVASHKRSLPLAEP